MTSQAVAAEQEHEPTPSRARAKIVSTAYRLFMHHGVQAIGVDRIVAEAGVAKATLYRHFPSKDDLVVAVLERRDELWTNEWLAQEIERRAARPSERLLAIFDALDEWFRRRDFEGCFFMNTLLEAHDRTSLVGAASAEGLANVRALVRKHAEEAGAGDADELSRRWQILTSGAIVAAAAGDLGAARRAGAVAAALLGAERLAS